MSQIPNEKRVAAIVRPGHSDPLDLVWRQIPKALPGQLLVKVEAAGVNRADALQCKGRYPAPSGVPSDVPGLEIAGEVIGAGEGVDPGMVGTRIAALVSGGGYAEVCAVPAGSSLPWPNGLDAIHSAALPEAVMTVWSNVFERGGLQAGETLLVHGGASGIGTMAIQLAKAYGALVIVTAGFDERCQKCRELGADVAINYRNRDFVQEVKEATEGRGADVILDIVGGAYIDRNYRAAAVEGRIVQIAFQEGPEAQVNFGALMMKRLTHTGSTLRSREDSFKTRLTSAVREKVWPLLESGKVRPIVDSVVSFETPNEALHRLDRDHFGKIVVKVSG